MKNCGQYIYVQYIVILITLTVFTECSNSNQMFPVGSLCVYINVVEKQRKEEVYNLTLTSSLLESDLTVVCCAR